MAKCNLNMDPFTREVMAEENKVNDDYISTEQCPGHPLVSTTDSLEHWIRTLSVGNQRIMVLQVAFQTQRRLPIYQRQAASEVVPYSI
jgi:hypothetical protein